MEVDCGPDEGPEDIVWAAAKVTDVSASGSFNVLVTEWDSLSADDPAYEAAYEEGPYEAADEGSEGAESCRHPCRELPSTSEGRWSWQLVALRLPCRARGGAKTARRCSW